MLWVQYFSLPAIYSTLAFPQELMQFKLTHAHCLFQLFASLASWGYMVVETGLALVLDSTKQIAKIWYIL